MNKLNKFLEKNDIVYKILYYISFIPGILCIILPIIAFFTGTEFIGSKITGMAAFELSLFAYILYFTIACPLIPIAIIYQILKGGFL